MSDDAGKPELELLEADLRQALQHRSAALERVAETQADLAAVMRRAAELVGREPLDVAGPTGSDGALRSASGGARPVTPPGSPSAG